MTGRLPKPATWRMREKSRKRPLRKRRATPRMLRATFVDDGAVADVVERLGVDRVRTAASARSAAKYEANQEAKSAAKYAVKLVANLETNLETSHEMNQGTAALAGATVPDAAGRTRDSSGR